MPKQGCSCSWTCSCSLSMSHHLSQQSNRGQKICVQHARALRMLTRTCVITCTSFMLASMESCLVAQAARSASLAASRVPAWVFHRSASSSARPLDASKCQPTALPRNVHRQEIHLRNQNSCSRCSLNAVHRQLQNSRTQLKTVQTYRNSLNMGSNSSIFFSGFRPFLKASFRERMSSSRAPVREWMSSNVSSPAAGPDTCLPAPSLIAGWLARAATALAGRGAERVGRAPELAIRLVGGCTAISTAVAPERPRLRSAADDVGALPEPVTVVAMFCG
jgi:hypothetical protein